MDPQDLTPSIQEGIKNKDTLIENMKKISKLATQFIENPKLQKYDISNTEVEEFLTNTIDILAKLNTEITKDQLETAQKAIESKIKEQTNNTEFNKIIDTFVGDIFSKKAKNSNDDPNDKSPVALIFNDISSIDLCKKNKDGLCDEEEFNSIMVDVSEDQKNKSKESWNKICQIDILIKKYASMLEYTCNSFLTKKSEHKSQITEEYKATIALSVIRLYFTRQFEKSIPFNDNKKNIIEKTLQKGGFEYSDYKTRPRSAADGINI
jgi:hypothetical protein